MRGAYESVSCGLCGQPRQSASNGDSDEDQLSHLLMKHIFGSSCSQPQSEGDATMRVNFRRDASASARVRFRSASGFPIHSIRVLCCAHLPRYKPERDHPVIPPVPSHHVFGFGNDISSSSNRDARPVKRPRTLPVGTPIDVEKMFLVDDVVDADTDSDTGTVVMGADDTYENAKGKGRIFASAQFRLGQSNKESLGG